MKTRQLPLLLLLIAIIPAFSFKPQPKAQDYRIAIGFAYKDMNCSGLTVKTAIGYEFKTSKGGSISSMTAEVRKYAALQNNVDSDDIVIKTGYRSNAVIITYKKKVSGWNCEKTMYAAGFGDSHDEAVNDAVGNMEASNASYTVLRRISVY